MTEKINVAEILKSKPVGTMLYDKARNISVYLKDVAKSANGCYGITCTFGTDRVQKLHYSHKGTLPFFENGMVILLPSQKMCDWKKITWKKGDVSGDCCAWVKDIVPINLVPAILEKNGWDKSTGWSYVGSKSVAISFPMN